MKNQIEEGDYIRCIYGDESELYGTVLWTSPNQILVAIDSSGVLTFVNTSASNLDIIEVLEGGE
jgi:hypothetical protein